MPSLEQLKAKYQAVIDLAKERGVQLKNVHLENDKLLIRGAAPSQAIKYELWDKIKAIDAKAADLSADISVDASLPVPAKIYEVVGGDTHRAGRPGPVRQTGTHPARPEAPAPLPVTVRLRGLVDDVVLVDLEDRRGPVSGGLEVALLGRRWLLPERQRQPDTANTA